MLQDEQTRDQPRRQAGLARPGGTYPSEAAIKETPIDLPRQPHQRMIEIDDHLQRRSQQIFLTIVPWLCHRVPQR